MPLFRHSAYATSLSFASSFLHLLGFFNGTTELPQYTARPHFQLKCKMLHDGIQKAVNIQSRVQQKLGKECEVDLIEPVTIPTEKVLLVTLSLVPFSERCVDQLKHWTMAVTVSLVRPSLPSSQAL